ncbi:hypothetical protein ACJIZ3_002277 [Penstemon smallii]|uniref:Uncharacterized protein n=1 Tax=Penstemon smallii TaxID=265156 RepID=A0ABD3U5Y4_9LAMI
MPSLPWKGGHGLMILIYDGVGPTRDGEAPTTGNSKVLSEWQPFVVGAECSDNLSNGDKCLVGQIPLLSVYACRRRGFDLRIFLKRF